MKELTRSVAQTCVDEAAEVTGCGRDAEAGFPHDREVPAAESAALRLLFVESLLIDFLKNSPDIYTFARRLNIAWPSAAQ